MKLHSTRSISARPPDVDGERDESLADGVCMRPGADPDMWCSLKYRPLALHLCQRHCPVRAQCNAVMTGVDPLLRVGLVAGGVAYGQTGKQVSALPCERCDECPKPRCVVCGGEFVSYHAAQVYCDQFCQRDAIRQRERTKRRAKAAVS